MDALRDCVLCALLLCRSAGTSGGSMAAAEQRVHVDENNFPVQDHMNQDLSLRELQDVSSLDQLPVKLLPPPFFSAKCPLLREIFLGRDFFFGSTVNLKVQVKDLLSRERLKQAVLEVFINYTINSTAVGGEDGEALLHVPFHSGLPVTLVASKLGYVSTALRCETSRIPIFSSVTMSVLRLNQGNIWLFEDSVLITRSSIDDSSQPIVKFPKSLLKLTHMKNITSVRAYLTPLKLASAQDYGQIILGIMSSKPGYVSVELSPVAAVGVQLFSGEAELHVSGPIEISLSLPDGCGLQTSNVVPAWFFNRTTGAWMRKGLGKVTLVDGNLQWKFTAPHLGYWMASPLPSTRGFLGLAFSLDFISHHAFFLMVLFGGTLLAVICLLFGLLYYCRREPTENKARKVAVVMQKDQTTCTYADGVFETSSGNGHPGDGQSPSFTEEADNQHNLSFFSMHSSNVLANPSAVECNEVELKTTLTPLTLLQTTEQAKLPPSFADSLLFYNQPVAILPAPAFFRLEERPDSAQWTKSATLPRAGASNSAATEPPSKDSSAQTLPKAPSAIQSPDVRADYQPGLSEDPKAANASNSTRGFSLPESASVPGTLNQIGHSRKSVHTLSVFPQMPSPQPPRAWFVSLEGQPAAEIHHAGSDQQRRRRPIESRDTSLDSGVDMSEVNQTSSRRAVTLERNATFVKSTSNNRFPAQQ